MDATDHAATLPRVLVIAGATGVGKTLCAIELARRFDGELIGADSVQVYRGFDIGASKPTAAELGGLRHHLIDVREPEDVLDAAAYAKLADAAIESVSAQGKLPIIVGGTGLWLRALLRGLVDLPASDAALRARLEAEWDVAGGVAMHARLLAVDPLSAARIHPNDKLRVVRALEVYEQTGLPLGAARAQHALGQPRYEALCYALDLPQVLHRERVQTRTRAMLEAGLVAEVLALIAKHGPAVRPLHSVGYKQVLAHLTQGVPIEDTEREIVRATLIYARRQRTWWNSDPSRTQALTAEALLGAETLREIEVFARR